MALWTPIPRALEPAGVTTAPAARRSWRRECADPEPIDQLTRWLRALASVAFILLIVVLVLDPSRRDISVLALLVGALALWLGYEVVLPFTRRGHDDD